MKIKQLSWDSDFFNYPVGEYRIKSENFNLEKFKSCAELYQLVYIHSTKPCNILSEKIILGDIKLTFTKKATLNKSNDHIIVFNEPSIDPLLSLALQSGEYSRFKLDYRLVNNEFERLYEAWLKKELDQGEILIYKNKDQIIGMVTISFKECKSIIGLIAVDEKYRGKGIGRALLEAAENVSFISKKDTLLVKTQLANKNALQLYLKNGYSEIEKTYLYHYYNSLL